MAILSFRTPGLEISTFSRKYFMSVFIGFRLWKTNGGMFSVGVGGGPEICVSSSKTNKYSHEIFSTKSRNF